MYHREDDAGDRGRGGGDALAAAGEREREGCVERESERVIYAGRK